MVELLHNSLFIAGGLSVAIPVALHLLMQRRPRRQVFPALRFLVRQRTRTQRSLHVRHWLLLFLRSLLLIVLALLLARPRITANATGIALFVVMLSLLCAALGGVVWLVLRAGRSKGLSAWVPPAAAVSTALLAALLLWGGGAQGRLWQDQEEPVSAIMVVDTSPRMQYRQEGTSRLHRAVAMAQQILAQFPKGSEFGVVASSDRAAQFLSDRGAFEAELRAIETDGVSEPMPARLRRAATLLESARHAHREVYLFSDLSSVAWQTESPDKWEQTVAGLNEATVQLLDVGVTDPQDHAIRAVDWRTTSILPDQAIELQVTVGHIGRGGKVDVELLMETPNPELPAIVDGEVVMPTLIARDRQTVDLDSGDVQVPLRATFRETGMYHGIVQLTHGQDGLPENDTFYFSCAVRAAAETWIASWDGAMTDALLGLPGLSFRVGTGQLLDEPDWSAARIVCLLDPPPLSDAVWQRATDYVSQGGQMVIMLGPRARPADQFASKGAVGLLPGKPVRLWRGDSVALRLRDTSHPATAALSSWESQVTWSDFPVFVHWIFADRPIGDVLVEFNQGMPAVVERRIGKGSVVTWTTPYGQPAGGRDAWNWLVDDSLGDAWPPLALVYELLNYLAQDETSRWNFVAGEAVRVQWPRATSRTSYQLFGPGQTWQTVTAEEDGSLAVPLAADAGTYRLRGDIPFANPGFSVNTDLSQCDVTRIAGDDRDALLSVGEWSIYTEVEDLRRQVRLRGTFEVYSPLLLLLAFLLACEHVAANWFYADVGARVEQVIDTGRAVT